MAIPEAFDFSFNVFHESNGVEGETTQSYWYAEISDETGEDMQRFASPADNPEFHESVLLALKSALEAQLESLELIKRAKQQEQLS